MKLPIIASVLFTFMVAACATLSAPSASDRAAMADLQSALDELDDGRVLVVAHRGCWSAAPENSIQSIKDCIAMGVEVVEIDVQLTADRELIVFHDRTLDRMTNGSGLVREATLADIRALQLYERDGSPHQIMDRKLLTNQRVPTLREMFAATRGRILINLEIKSNDVFSFAETYQAALDLARDMGVENEVLWKIPSTARTYDVEIVLGFSGSSDAATPADHIVNSIDTEGLLNITPIVWDGARDFATQLEDFADNDVRLFEIVTDDLSHWPLGEDGRIIGSDRHRYMGIAVLPRWSGGLSDDVALADPGAAWGRLIDLGADLIMTDRPEQLIDYLEARGLR
jgi:glycerophosphoryl diester phosphodiesterase